MPSLNKISWEKAQPFEGKYGDMKMVVDAVENHPKEDIDEIVNSIVSWGFGEK